uniref:ODAD1 central coiled coil region domain-containing protein n=1 Tax=Electrophorus electricus TaxID=8005 RepID=A0A4W4GSY7_ELEEL
MEKKRHKESYIDTLKRPGTEQKRTHILKDRVHLATRRFDKLVSKSQEIRNDIDHLRQQRATMTSMYQRLDRELQKQQRVMEALVEKSVIAYDQRSEVLMRMLAVHDQSEDCDMEERARREKSRSPPETYQAVHQRIVELMGESDLHQISRTLVDNEEENFANFIYVNELNSKASRLQHRNSELKVLHGLCSNLAELEVKCLKANTLQAKNTQVCKVLDQQKSAISDLFKKLNCDPTPIMNRPDGSVEVTDYNITQFIGMFSITLLHCSLHCYGELVSVLLQDCIEKPMDYQTLHGHVLLHKLKKEQGKLARIPASKRKARKKMGPKYT